MEKKQVEEPLIRNGIEKLTNLETVSKANNVNTVLLNVLEKNNFTFEEALALLEGFSKGFAEVIEKNPSKRTELVKTK